MPRFVLIIFFLNFSLRVSATTFIPVRIEKQIESSTAAAIVEMINSRAYKNHENRITTEYSFKILRYFGNTDHFENKMELKFSLPGGSLNGIKTVVAESPVFKTHVPVFVLLKEVDSKMVLSNFTMGKFDLVNIRGEEYFVNAVYPERENIGRVKKAKMLKLLSDAWGPRFVESVSKEVNPSLNFVKNENHNQIENNYKKIDKREPASFVEEGFSISQIIVYFFAVLGILIALIILRKDKNEGD